MKKSLITLCAIAVIALTAMVGCSNSSAKDVQPLGIIGAMEEEVEIIKSKMNVQETVEIANMTFYRGTIDGKEIVLVRSGVGKVNMAACTQLLIDQFNVEALINSGVAGTLNPELNQGDIVLSTAAVQHDFDTTAVGGKLGEIDRLGIDFFPASQELLATAKKAASTLTDISVVEGDVASGDQFVAGGETAQKIKDHFGEVSAVEMEGAAMAQVAYLNEIPYLIIRSIFDKADGGADLSYEEFLPLAAKNSSEFVLKLIELY